MRLGDLGSAVLLTSFISSYLSGARSSMLISAWFFSMTHSLTIESEHAGIRDRTRDSQLLILASRIANARQWFQMEANLLSENSLAPGPPFFNGDTVATC